MTQFCRLLAVFWVFLAMAGAAHAEGFALYEYSARGVALGGALMARQPDPSTVAYNPALLTKLPGVRLMGGVTLLTPEGSMRTFDPDTGTQEVSHLKNSLWAIPHAYYTHQINDKWYFGIGEFSRFGLGFEYPHDWPGRKNIYEVSLQSASLNPNIAWAATDKLSLAAGVELVYVNLDIRKRIGIPAMLGGGEVDSNIQDAEDIGVGFNLAGHYQFNDKLAVGLQYRSQVRVHAHGDVEFTNLGALDPVFNAAFKDGGADSTVILPDSVAGGIAWTPVPELSIEAGAIWTRWSTFRHLNIHLPDPMQPSQNPKHWEDVWRFNVGVEYKALDWLTLRGGYVYDESPMTSAYADYLVPTNDRNIYSVGLGLNWDTWTVDLAYAYVDAKERSYTMNSATNVLDSKVESGHTNLFTVSVGYAF